MSGRPVARGAILNLAGYLIPLLVAVATIPVTIRALGPDQFGLLAFAWVILAYSTVFDLGISRAATRFTAEAIALRDDDRLMRLAWSAVAANTMLGIAGSILIGALSPVLARTLNVPPDLVGDAQTSLLIVAASIPITLIGTAFRGLLEAGYRFDLVNLVSAPSSALLYALPAAASTAGLGVPAILTLILLSRLCSTAAFAVLAHRALGGVLKNPAVEGAALRRLVSFGGWVTISSVVGTVFAYGDRFLISYFRSVGAVTYYAIPYEIVARLWIVPNAISAALFPAFSSLAESSSIQIGRLYARGLLALLCLLLPIVTILVLFSDELLEVWVGPEVARASALILNILAIGVFVNSLAFVPFALIQGANRPDLIGKLELAALVPFLVVGAFFAQTTGAVGVALSLTIRLIAEAGLLFATAGRVVPAVSSLLGSAPVLPSMAGAGIALACAIVARALGASPPERALFVTLVICFSLFVAWRHAAEPDDRETLLGFVRSHLQTERR